MLFEIRKRGRTGCLSKNKGKLAYNSMHSITALENLTTCNTKGDGVFQFPSLSNTPQHCHIEASPCQTVRREEQLEGDGGIDRSLSWKLRGQRKKWSTMGSSVGTGIAHEHVGHHLSTWAGEVLQKSC